MGFLLQRDNLIRMPINPTDKSTVVSVYGKQLEITKETLYPRRFTLEAAPVNDISILVVGTGSWWRDIDPEQAPIEIQTNSAQIAKSIVDDFINSVVGYNGPDCQPGLFWVNGPHDQKMWNRLEPADIEKIKLTIKTQYKAEIERARVAQKNWFGELVKMADVDWARTNGNPLSVSDDARFAAELLGLKNKAWMQDFTMMQMENCPACGALRNPMYPICGSCKTIVDTKKYKELGLQQAV